MDMLRFGEKYSVGIVIRFFVTSNHYLVLYPGVLRLCACVILIFLVCNCMSMLIFSLIHISPRFTFYI
jgi:hypothetical protein